MRHSSVTTTHIILFRTVILCLASICLLALRFAAQHIIAVETSSPLKVLGSINGTERKSAVN